MQENEKDFITNLREDYPDEVHKFICNLIGSSYCNQEEFNQKLKEFFHKLNNNSYGIKYKEEA